ncbi:MAG: alpha/beta hydrolase [Hyphomicrobiaceae bacterium]
MSGADELFPGFASRNLDTGSVVLHFRLGGSGPPLLLVHGYPQTQLCWHKVVGTLAKRFTIVAPDLRGYGRSSCPADDLEHRAYSKRTMAGDLAELMAKLGFDRYHVMGHDRGGRVAYRMALERPHSVSRLILLDVISTWDWWQPEQQAIRRKGVHWAFLAQPSPIPETLIGGDPAAWVHGVLMRGTSKRSLDPFHPKALEDYCASLSDPDRVHATCEDFRAGASCDLYDDWTERRLGRRIECPTFVVWGQSGSLGGISDPIALWRNWCVAVTGCMIDSGHFLAEENPDAVLKAVLPFLGASES